MQFWQNQRCCLRNFKCLVREEQSKIDDSILECEADHDTVLRIVKKAQEILGLDKDKSTYLRSIIRYVSAPDLVIPDHHKL